MARLLSICHNRCPSVLHFSANSWRRIVYLRKVSRIRLTPWGIKHEMLSCRRLWLRSCRGRRCQLLDTSGESTSALGTRQSAPSLAFVQVAYVGGPIGVAQVISLAAVPHITGWCGSRSLLIFIDTATLRHTLHRPLANFGMRAGSLRSNPHAA